ncbi:MAG: FAD-dependent oxidoreductase, partial [Betaproteobacteria bacterium]|nr:FAD-dependent oxidoreductase [Betaproteobacteria bacterium]
MADGPPLSPLRRVQAEVLVVGASFAGCAAAIAAARRGARVALIERKADPGAKLHTTGILVHEVQTQHALLAGIPPALVRPIDTVRLYAPNLREIVLRAPGYHFLATDTPALMRWLVEQAGQAGVDVRLGCSYTSAQRQAGLWQVDGVGESRYLIGADGPQSRVAHSLTLGRNQRFLYGVEHELTGVALPDPNALHCFITRAHAPGYIGWALQGVSALQFGLAVPQAHAGSAAAR